MRFSRLFFLCAVFVMMSVSANAQFTTRSNSGLTTKTGTSGSHAVKLNSPKTPAAASQTSGKSFTTNSRPAATAPTARAASASAPQSVFRPRPQKSASDEEEDDLPSFDALEGKDTQASKDAGLPPPPPPKGEIWFYIANFKYGDRTGITMHCEWKVVVQNRTDTPITNMKILYSLLDIEIAAYVNKTEPNGSMVVDHAFFTKKCPAMVGIKPKIKVESCKMGGLSKPEECQKYIVVK